ncbi:N-6 DNA methylase [Fusobacterium necrogenes]|uniref:N-6 DNA methylase n=1 Tax=Fusobacterium necrogenes TaxID=858 RepID=UPI00255CFAE6|nr:N-6 DNA methylase [Fusobacterium necrogenes]
MQILRRYNFNETEKIGLLSIQQLGEVYISLKEEQNFLREPYSLVKNLEKIDFYEKENRESIEKYLESICECHQFLKKYKSLIGQFSNEDFKEFFTFRKIYSQDLARGLYKDIALKILNKIEAVERFDDSTPREVNLITDGTLKVKKEESCLDFAFGKGSLAIQVANKNIYGMEINSFYREVAQLMIEIANKEGEVKLGDALKDKIDEADVVVSNPPFGLNILSNEDKEYLQWGNPLRSSDTHFISLALSKMKSRGALVLPQGALFRGGAEGEVRKKIIDEGYVEGIISLPNNIMNFTGIPISIVFLRKDKVIDKVFMFDATKDFFKKVRGGVVIEDKTLERIIDIYNNFEEIEGISKMVSVKEILENDGVLNVGRYIEVKVEQINSTKLLKKMKETWNRVEEFKNESDLILEKLMQK